MKADMESVKCKFMKFVTWLISMKKQNLSKYRPWPLVVDILEICFIVKTQDKEIRVFVDDISQIMNMPVESKGTDYAVHAVRGLPA